jgi:hypothetical protein
MLDVQVQASVRAVVFVDAPVAVVVLAVTALFCARVLHETRSEPQTPAQQREQEQPTCAFVNA